jgi:hypothetical protein
MLTLPINCGKTAKGKLKKKKDNEKEHRSRKLENEHHRV